MKHSGKIKGIVTATVISLLFALTGCKNKFEKRGDAYLEAGKIKNAVQNYLKAKKAGEVSDEFNDNYALGLTRLLLQTASSNATSDNILNYKEKIPKLLGNSQNQEVITEYAETIGKVAVLQVKEEMFAWAMEAFELIKSARKVAKSGTAKAALDKYQKQCEDMYLTRALPQATGMSDLVAAEYYLLEADLLVPGDERIATELKKVRKKNLHSFLIWSEEVNGITRPNPKIDKWGFIFAFRQGELNIGKNEMKAYTQVWNTSGSNVGLTAKDFQLVSKDGRKVDGVPYGSLKCEKLENEGECSLGISFRYGADFQPDYVLLQKDKAGEGRKYLGT